MYDTCSTGNCLCLAHDDDYDDDSSTEVIY